MFVLPDPKHSIVTVLSSLYGLVFIQAGTSIISSWKHFCYRPCDETETQLATQPIKNELDTVSEAVEDGERTNAPPNFSFRYCKSYILFQLTNLIFPAVSPPTDRTPRATSRPRPASRSNRRFSDSSEDFIYIFTFYPDVWQGNRGWSN